MSGAAGLRVVVADDHPVFRDGLVSVLSDRGVDVCAAVSSGEAALEAVEAHGPDVVLMDLGMDGIGGVEATRRISVTRPNTAVLVLTMNDDDASLFAALRAGAGGYLLKEASADDIVRALASVSSGDTVIGSRMGEMALAALSGRSRGARHFPQLTDREFDVLDLVARGKANPDVARTLGVSEKTVRNHVSAILTKLPATTRAEAIAKARDVGVGSDPG